jgi:hypothetical protein
MFLKNVFWVDQWKLINTVNEHTVYDLAIVTNILIDFVISQDQNNWEVFTNVDKLINRRTRL